MMPNSYVFDAFRLDPARRVLRQGEQEVELPLKAFQVLTFLVEKRDRVVLKQELMEAIWKDTAVTDDALVQAIIALRRALGDNAEQPRYIRTKPRVGYQFVAPVEVHDDMLPLPTSIAPVRPDAARALFLTIQVGYLVLYSLVLAYAREAAQLMARGLAGASGVEGTALGVLVFLALTGIAVRLYLLTSVGLDHPQAGLKFTRLFPFLLVLDLLSALARCC
jgi:DNA-binding winged helix-turn-helix (wHTH) protein